MCCSVNVTNTGSNYRKLARIDHNEGEYHFHQESLEPKSIKAACIHCQVSWSIFYLTSLLNISPPNATTSKGKRPMNVGVSRDCLYHGCLHTTEIYGFL